MKLAVRDLVVGYGGVQALRGVSLDLEAGEIVGMVGANGAGKSSLLHAIMGLTPALQGRVLLDGEDLLALKTTDIVARGVGLVPERRELFGKMTCRQNLAVAYAHAQRGRSLKHALTQVYAVFPRLADREHQTAGSLSGGEQQMLAIGRMLMQDPRVILLDEPSLGLAPSLAHEVCRTLRSISGDARAILLVEQRARLVAKLVDRAYLMTCGTIEPVESLAGLGSRSGAGRYFGIAEPPRRP